MDKGGISIIREIRAELRTDAAFEIYAACMYQPAQEKYPARIVEYLADPAVCCFGAFDGDRLTGILIVRAGEILGVAVRKDMRGQGVGRALILHALHLFPTLTAETDEDSVGFYRRCGFVCQAFTRTFPDGTCTRFRCMLRT